MFWEDWPENLLSVEDAVECRPDPQQDWGTHFLSHPLLLAAVGSQFLPQNCPQQKLPCQLHHLPRDTLLPVTGGDRDTALVSIPHLWRVIQLQHALWDGLASPAAVLQFNFRQCLLRSMRLSYKKANNSDLSRLQVLKNHCNQWGVVWRKFFLLLSPGEFVLMLTSSLCRPSFRLSLLKTGNRWKSLDYVI